MTEAKFKDSASSASASGNVLLQGSNNNSSWTNVATMPWSTGTDSTQKYGIATGYKYYRFQFTITASGSNWVKVSASGFIAYK